jgi:hypothetical protein
MHRTQSEEELRLEIAAAVVLPDWIRGPRVSRISIAVMWKDLIGPEDGPSDFVPSRHCAVRMPFYLR